MEHKILIKENRGAIHRTILLQCDQLIMTVLFWYLGKSDLSTVTRVK